MDVLVLGSNILYKQEQPEWPESKGHIEEYGQSGPEGREDKFEARMRELFRRRVVPLSPPFNESETGETFDRFRRGPTAWVKFEDLETSAIFEYPAEMLSQEPSQMASAICSQWMHRDTADTLKPILRELLELDTRYPAAPERRSDAVVSEYIYEMF